MSNRSFFSKILCFSQPEFQTFFAHSFIMEIGLQHFIYNRHNLEPILRGQQELGAHNDVVEFQQNKISTFKWTHHGTRPMGFGFLKSVTTFKLWNQLSIRITLKLWCNVQFVLKLQRMISPMDGIGLTILR